MHARGRRIHSVKAVVTQCGESGKHLAVRAAHINNASGPVRDHPADFSGNLPESRDISVAVAGMRSRSGSISGSLRVQFIVSSLSDQGIGKRGAAAAADNNVVAGGELIVVREGKSLRV